MGTLTKDGIEQSILEAATAFINLLKETPNGRVMNDAPDPFAAFAEEFNVSGAARVQLVKDLASIGNDGAWLESSPNTSRNIWKEAEVRDLVLTNFGPLSRSLDDEHRSQLAMQLISMEPGKERRYNDPVIRVPEDNNPGGKELIAALSDDDLATLLDPDNATLKNFLEANYIFKDGVFEGLSERMEPEAYHALLNQSLLGENPSLYLRSDLGLWADNPETFGSLVEAVRAEKGSSEGVLEFFKGVVPIQYHGEGGHERQEEHSRALGAVLKDDIEAVLETNPALAFEFSKEYLALGEGFSSFHDAALKNPQVFSEYLTAEGNHNAMFSWRGSFSPGFNPDIKQDEGQQRYDEFKTAIVGEMSKLSPAERAENPGYLALMETSQRREAIEELQQELPDLDLERVVRTGGRYGDSSYFGMKDTIVEAGNDQEDQIPVGDSSKYSPAHDGVTTIEGLETSSSWGMYGHDDAIILPSTVSKAQVYQDKGGAVVILLEDKNGKTVPGTAIKLEDGPGDLENLNIRYPSRQTGKNLEWEPGDRVPLEIHEGAPPKDKVRDLKLSDLEGGELSRAFALNKEGNDLGSTPEAPQQTADVSHQVKPNTLG